MDNLFKTPRGKKKEKEIERLFKKEREWFKIKMGIIGETSEALDIDKLAKRLSELNSKIKYLEEKVKDKKKGAIKC